MFDAIKKQMNEMQKRLDELEKRLKENTRFLRPDELESQQQKDSSIQNEENE